MSSDNFDKTLFRQPKPGGDRTTIKSNPGGQKTPTPGWTMPEQQARQSNPLPYESLYKSEAGGGHMDLGINPLVSLASTLLAVSEKTKHAISHPDVAGLYRRLVDAIKQFRARANERGIPRETILHASYLLCSVLDEAVLNTPWGSQSPWGQRTLLSVFHKEATGGKGSFVLIDRMRQRPAENLDFLELSYLCLSLGFKGKYRLMSTGRDELEKLRDELFRTIRNYRGEYERGLSPTWHGLGKTRNTLSEYIPMWVIACCVAAVLFFSYSGFRYWLYQMSDPIVEELTEIAAVDDKKSK